ncbi:MAG: hypothetical protein IJC04_07870 [Oscillospiraceae bacterium]|nr:hypothetical protein [Oscillospiraceae bacterium]
MKRLDDIRYNYHSLSVPGGGFVTGFVFHPNTKNILYARTDIGGIYRFDFNSHSWHSLADWITEYKRYLALPLSLALDEDTPNMLYAMCGNNRKGFPHGKSALLISDNYGESFIEKAVPFCCNGNAPARSSAERLAYKNDTLFFGSQGEGLWQSADNGESWTKLDFCEENIVFVYFPKGTKIMLVSCTGETTADGNNRGHTLYASYDFGKSFEKLDIPAPIDDERCSHCGFVPYSIASDENNVYISFTHSFHGNPWGRWNDFACDNGGGFDGRLYRYTISDGKLYFDKDLTPILSGFTDVNAERWLPFGLGGVDVHGNVIAVCSVGGHGDSIFISCDNGKSYETITSTDIERFRVDVPYLKSEYNGKRIPLHWMSCLRIDPFNPDFAVINTGTGIFTLNGLTTGKSFVSTLCSGVEETVHMNIYALPSGKNKVIDLVGDLGGFVFDDLDKPCENSFANENSDRYITCLNADFVQNNPDTFITTARGNWTGETKGGVILTKNGGESFTHIGYPTGISHKLDEASERINKPNVNSGWAAISSDGKTILWTLAYEHMKLPCFCAVRYNIDEKIFSKIKIYDLQGNDISEGDLHIKLFADRINKNKAYGFGENGQLYLSTDSGASFRQLSVPKEFPLCNMSGIDGYKGVEIRFIPNCEGVCYAALCEHGLWKLCFGEDCVRAERITESSDFVKAVGFGIGNSENEPALFICGRIFGEYGFWKSPDSGEGWAKINTSSQMFGTIVSMDGDFRIKGRVYIATGTRGGFYGDENIQCH